MSRDQQRRVTPEAPEVEEILATLSRHSVSFVVIGGAAVVHHGFPRMTKDIDIVPEPSNTNLNRLWKALVEMEAEPFLLGEFRADEFPPFTLQSLLDLGNWDLATKYGRVDVLQQVMGKLETADDYKGLAERADTSDFDFGTVLFAGFDDLIDLKNLAGRAQDMIDIRALKEARGDISPQ